MLIITAKADGPSLSPASLASLEALLLAELRSIGLDATDLRIDVRPDHNHEPATTAA